MALPVRRREQTTSRSPSAWGPFRELDELQGRMAELLISGEIEERERNGILRRRARRTGCFEYRVAVPSRPDPGARLADGVLTVRVHEPEPARSRRVEVQSGTAA
jgi:HSP20 family molecular chaperone IbpA